MATYEQWNERLFNYITSGVPRGARVYLAIDDEVIDFLSNQFGTNSSDFSQAVRLRCVKNNVINLDRIYLSATSQEQYKNRPRYLAFLCAMVLAAYRMGESADQGVSNIDYFYYFNSILGFPVEGRRPPGMEHGAEEKLWKDWSIWLKFNGFQPTALKVGDHYYTYARSQALLRQSDKNNLWKFFSNHQHKFPDDIGKDELVQRIIIDANYGLTNHLRDLLSSDGKIGTQRYDDLADTLYENFEAWVASGRQSERTSAFRTLSKGSISAGLYRIEDFLSRQPQYFLLPKQPRYIQAIDLSVSYKGETIDFENERPGWYEPLPWEVGIAQIDTGLTLSLNGNQLLHNLVLPKKDFWILVPDPDDITSGTFATWEERPELGVPFILLAKKELEKDLNTLKEEGLITWSSNPKSMDNWQEYTNMIVISDAWGSALIENKGLINQLRPKGSLSISLRGGLRDLQNNAWLVEHGPEIIVNSFFDDIEIDVLKTGEEEVIAHLEAVSGDVTIFTWESPGNYQLRVKSGGEVRERQVIILDWGGISLAKPGKHKPMQVGNTVVFGARLKE